MIKHSAWELRRRDFLKRLGVGLGMMPLLWETRAEGAASARGRLIVFTKANSINADTFWPTWAAGRPADGSLDSATLPSATAPLDQFKKHLIFPDGLAIRSWLKSEGNPTGDNGNAHHNWGSLLTGALPAGPYLTAGGCGLNKGGCLMQGGGPSIDHYVAQQFHKLDPSLPDRSINVGLLGSTSINGFTTASWKDKAIGNPRENDPLRVFDFVFNGRTANPVAPSGPEAEKRRLDRLRVLDYTHKDIERFRTRLGSEDRLLVESHLQSVHERRKQIEGLMTPAGAPARTCKVTSPMAQALTEPNVGKASKIMLDLVFDAFRCGVARSFVFTFFDSNAYNTFFTWLRDRNPSFGNNTVKASEFPELHYHSLAHGGGREPGRTLYNIANRWHVEQAAYLMERLRDEPEGAGSMLDSTLLLWTDMLSSGGGHSVYRMPWFLGGNVDRYFTTGRHVKTSTNAAQNGLFVSIANALGIAPANQVFGDAKFGSGELPGLHG